MLNHKFDRLMAGEADQFYALTKQRDKLEDETLRPEHNQPFKLLLLVLLN